MWLICHVANFVTRNTHNKINFYVEPKLATLSPPDSISTSSDSNDATVCTAYALSTSAMTATLIVPIPIESDADGFDAARMHSIIHDSDSRDR